MRQAAQEKQVKENMVWKETLVTNADLQKLPGKVVTSCFLMDIFARTAFPCIIALCQALLR